MRVAKSAQKAFDEAKRAQELYWEALFRLEEVLGREIDGTLNLSDISVSDLLRR